MPNDLVFSIATQTVMDGRELRSVKPNKDGVYEGIPLGAIGINSRNRVNYDPNSVINCITSKTSRMNINIQEGNMEGEWGHPCLKGKEDLHRLLYIDRMRVSHYFPMMYAKPTKDGNYIVIYGNVVPCGPAKQYLVESFEDPKRNTCFSLRSASKTIRETPECTYKKMLALITFDSVDGPGFKVAGKRYQDTEPSVQSIESIDVDVTKEDVLSAKDAISMVGCESLITDHEIQDIFGADVVRIREEVVGVYDAKHNIVRSPNGCQSVFGSMFRGK